MTKSSYLRSAFRSGYASRPHGKIVITVNRDFHLSNSTDAR